METDDPQKKETPTRFATQIAFDSLNYKPPIMSNSLFENTDNDAVTLELARDTYPVAPSAARALFRAFLEIKREKGSLVEQRLYANMDECGLMTRLMLKRPQVFMNANDQWLLRTLQQGAGRWDTVGTDYEQAPLVLDDYLSYDEIALSALCGASGRTYFINSGDRHNCGRRRYDCEPEGIYVGLVGCRFERENFMEWRHMVVTPEQNRLDQGYGSPQGSDALLQAWAAFYGIECFPSFEQAAEQPERFLRVHLHGAMAYLDALVYTRRVEITAQLFLQEANGRAEKVGKRAYCHVVGLGLGVWAISPDQNELFVNAFLNTVPKLDLPNVVDLDFAWIVGTRPSEIYHDRQGNPITIVFSKRDPAAQLHDPSKLLVASFAWDANSYPGNEYWLGSLDASGDPAAAACSAIGELFNPDINPAALEGSRTRWH